MMNRRRLWLPVLLTTMILVVAAGVVLGAGKTLLSDPPNLGADYRGSESCSTCHNRDDHGLWEAWSFTAHAWSIRPANEQTVLGDLSEAASPVISWPDGEQRSLTLSDITYTIGGRYTQQYIGVFPREAGEEGYHVLPVIWNIPQTDDQEGVWTLDESADWTSAENDWRITCAGCHTSNLTGDALERGADFELAGDWQRGDIELGIGCEACHGPGGDHGGGANPMPRTPDAQVCGQCHTQGVDVAGNHPFPLNYQPGLPLDESFVMADLDDEGIWWSTGHARASASQYNEWLESAHANSLTTLQESDLAEDWCLRCHAAPPDSTDPDPEPVEQTVADVQFGVTCVACHNAHPADSQPRAGLAQDEVEDKRPSNSLDLSEGKYTVYIPGLMLQEGEDPGVRFLMQDDPYTLCVACHNSTNPTGEVMLVGDALHHPVQEMFEGQGIIEAVDGTPSIHFSAEEGPRCMACHMTRTIAIGEYGRSPSHRLTVALPNEVDEGQPDSCTTCHEGLSPADLQSLVVDTQDVVLDRLTVAWTRLAGVGQPETGTVERVQYNQMITALNFVQNDGSLGVHNYAYSDELLDFVEFTMSELGVGVAIQPTEAPAPTATGDSPAIVSGAEEVTSETGVRPITRIIIGLTLLILAVAAFLFFRSPSDQEAQS